MENPFRKKEEAVPDPKAATDNTEALLAKMGELLSPIKSAVDSYGTRLQAIEENARPKAPVTPPAETQSVFDDEDKAFAQRLTPLAVEQVLLKARIIEGDILREHSEWSEFFPEIKRNLAETPIQVKAGSNYETYVKNVINMVIGEAASKGGLRRDKQRFVLEDGNSHGNVNDDPATQADKDFLNFKVTTAKGKVVTRGEFLKRMGNDISDPEVLKKVKESWATMQVIN